MKLFEVLGVKKEESTDAHQMVDDMLSAAMEVMDDIFPDGPDEVEDAHQNLECKVFHDDDCESVVAKDFDLCHCSCLRMEVHLITDGEVTLKLASGKILPRDMALRIRRDDTPEPTGDLN